MADAVLVLGGGIAGMTAAHELAERGFRVTVVERHSIPGGKARSLPVPGTATDGHPALPAEHGFRFFPGFYSHVPDTMRRIPFKGNAHGVYGNLRESTRAEIARDGLSALVLPTTIPGDRAEQRLWLRNTFANGLHIPMRDWFHFMRLIVQMLASCDERRYDQYEQESWWSFSGADHRSRGYQQFLADGLTRSLVAAKAREMSARTGGYTLIQLLQSFGPHPKDRGVDRVLDGPTNEVWIQPWLDHLRSLGVEYKTDLYVTRMEMDGDRVSAVWWSNTTHKQVLEGRMVDFDWIVAALPVERMAPLVTDEMAAIEPGLRNLSKLTTRWMNGVMFYLRRPVPVTHGHVIYIDSPWSLTSISQAQFWTDTTDLTHCFDGTVCDILSVDVSDWETPGIIPPYKRAIECTHQEIVAEVWLQLKEHLNGGREPLLTDDDLVGGFVDQDILPEWTKQTIPVRPMDNVNLEPLLINTAGSWDLRPTAATAVPNLFLASDYVRTYTDLATMEGANEAARRAVNALLDATGSKAERCEIFPLHEPALFRPLRWIDRLLYRRRHGSHTGGPGPGR